MVELGDDWKEKINRPAPDMRQKTSDVGGQTRNLDLNVDADVIAIERARSALKREHHQLHM